MAIFPSLLSFFIIFCCCFESKQQQKLSTTFMQLTSTKRTQTLVTCVVGGLTHFVHLLVLIWRWGWPQNGPILTKNIQTWWACQGRKVVPEGQKWPKLANLPVFDHLGSFWVHLELFGPFQAIFWQS